MLALYDEYCVLLHLAHVGDPGFAANVPAGQPSQNSPPGEARIVPCSRRSRNT